MAEVEFPNPHSEIAEGIVAISADYDADLDDHLIFVTTGSSANITVKLPAPSAANQGMRILCKKVDSGNKSVVMDANTNGSTIDGANTKTIATQYDYIEVVNTGTVWYVVNKFLTA